MTPIELEVAVYLGDRVVSSVLEGFAVERREDGEVIIHGMHWGHRVGIRLRGAEGLTRAAFDRWLRHQVAQLIVLRERFA